MNDGASRRSTAQRLRREREKAARRADAARRREAARRAGTNGVAPESTTDPSHARNGEHRVRGQTAGRHRRETTPGAPADGRSWAPVYPAGSLHGPVYDKRGDRIPAKAPKPIGWLRPDGTFVRKAAIWTWDAPCPDCGRPTEYGCCTRCRWVCANADRPPAEPVLYSREIAA